MGCQQSSAHSTAANNVDAQNPRSRPAAGSRKPEQELASTGGVKVGGVVADAGPLVAPVPTDPDSLIRRVRDGVIGRDTRVRTPFGERVITYADYTASGRALDFVEDFMLRRVLPLYANTHTEVTATGLQTTIFREEARHTIADCVHAADDKDAVIFTGTGATGAIHKLMCAIGLYCPSQRRDALLSTIPPDQRPVVLVSHMEHHSNDVMWRESIAELVHIRPGDDGLPDLAHLREACERFKGRPLRVGSFSAGSNVTGMVPDVLALAEVLHEFGFLACFDYAGSGAYVDIDMNPKDRPNAYKDAIFLSPHKFVGGPGASGVLVVKRAVLTNKVPVIAGGGTVTFVSATSHSFEDVPEAREEGGTPGIPQCIRAGLAFQVKQLVGPKRIEAIEREHVFRVLNRWKEEPNLMLMGSDRAGYWRPNRLTIVSFNVRCECDDGKTRFLHQHFVSQLLNDLYGIQSRSGCSCAGPYGIWLFGAQEESVRRMAALAIAGTHSPKMGWARVNFNWFVSEEEVDFVAEAIMQVARHGWKLLPLYVVDPQSGQWHRHAFSMDRRLDSLIDGRWLQKIGQPVASGGDDRREYLQRAMDVYERAKELVGLELHAVARHRSSPQHRLPAEADDLRMFALPEQVLGRLGISEADIAAGVAAMREPLPTDVVLPRVSFYTTMRVARVVGRMKYRAAVRTRSVHFSIMRPRA